MNNLIWKVLQHQYELYIDGKIDIESAFDNLLCRKCRKNRNNNKRGVNNG